MDGRAPLVVMDVLRSGVQQSLVGNAVLLHCMDEPRGPETPGGRSRAEVRKASRIPRFGFRGATGPDLQVNTKFLLPVLKTWRLPSFCRLWLIPSEKRGVTRNLGG